MFEVEGWSTIEGNFVDGEIEGRGSKQWVDGRRYEGDFSRGEACGEGWFKSPSGESYVGTWAQNKRHGHGQLVLPNGQGTYTGEFRRHRYEEGLLTLLARIRARFKCYLHFDFSMTDGDLVWVKHLLLRLSFLNNAEFQSLCTLLWSSMSTE